MKILSITAYKCKTTSTPPFPQYNTRHSREEAIFALTHTVHTQHSQNDTPTYVAFIDFATAFTSTCRPAVWHILHDKGVRGRIWRNLQRLYDTPKGRVIHPLIDETDHFNFHTGLMEGSCLSPTLYAYFIDTLITELQEQFPDRCIQKHTQQQAWIGAILYADNLALTATSPQELHQMLVHTEDWAK